MFKVSLFGASLLDLIRINNACISNYLKARNLLQLNLKNNHLKFVPAVEKLLEKPTTFREALEYPCQAY